MIRCILTCLIGWSSLSSYGQFYNQKLHEKLNELQSVVHHLDSFERFGIKSNNSKALEQTGNWLFRYAQDHGYIVSFDSFVHPTGSIHRNIIVDFKSVADNEYLLLGAHYDTKNGPGVNDNGTGVAAILESMRLVKELAFERSIRFVFFSAEEDGFYGSQHYVDSVLTKDDRQLILMINLDQLGGSKGQADNDKIYCERDMFTEQPWNNEASSKMCDTMAQLVKLYTNLEPVISDAYSSDYIPFEEHGEIIAGFYQFSNFPYYHTINDSLSNLDTNSLNQVLRAVAATVLHFSRAEDMVSTTAIHGQKLILYPNPSIGVVYGYPLIVGAEYEVLNTMGQLIESGLISSNKEIDLSHLTNGYYFVKIQERNNTYMSQFFINR